MWVREEELKGGKVHGANTRRLGRQTARISHPLGMSPLTLGPLGTVEG